MITLAAIILIFIFSFLSGLHVYWAFGGRWASDGVFRPLMNKLNFLCGVIPTLIVAFGLLFFAFIVLIQISPLRLPYFHEIINKYGLWAITGIFLLRAIGEFYYVGLFKSETYNFWNQRHEILHTLVPGD